GHPGLIDALDRARDSYNTDAVAQAAATAALRARDHAASTWARVIAERGRVRQRLSDMGFHIPGSHTNFLLATVPAGAGAAELFESLKQEGIYVRYFTHERLRDKLRITIGTPEQNDALLDELNQLLQAHS